MLLIIPNHRCAPLSFIWTRTILLLLAIDDRVEMDVHEGRVFSSFFSRFFRPQLWSAPQHEKIAFIGNVFVLWGASPVTVRCASPVTAGVQVRSLSITDDLSHSPSDLPTRWYGTIMVHFLFFSPKKIPHHVENAWYYDPRRSNKNADAPMIL